MTQTYEEVTGQDVHLTPDQARAKAAVATTNSLEQISSGFFDSSVSVAATTAQTADTFNVIDAQQSNQDQQSSVAQHGNEVQEAENESAYAPSAAASVNPGRISISQNTLLQWLQHRAVEKSLK